MMKEIEKNLQEIAGAVDTTQEETKLPSLEAQREIVKKLKALEASGELTPEILASYFDKYTEDEHAGPIH